MFEYLKGKVVYKGGDYVVLEANNIGYNIQVSNILDFELNLEYTIYIYDILKNEIINLFGFKSLDVKKLFLKLITVKGVGPKTALNMFKDYDDKRIINAINEEDTRFLKKLPNIGIKVAKQIILDLKGKLVEDFTSLSKELIDVKEALKGLGFKVNDIEKVLLELSKENHSLDDYIKLALIKLNKL